MNHFGKIAQQLSAHGLDAMLVTSAPGEFYAARLPWRGHGRRHPGPDLVLHRLPVYRGCRPSW